MSVNKPVDLSTLSHDYDYDFELTPEYEATLPDLAEGDIKGSAIKIQKVGISNFHLPLRIKTQRGETQELEASIVGTVSLDAVKKGINMSRIIRTFYDYKNEIFDINKLGEVLTQYRERLGSYEATIYISFRYRIWQEALRTRDTQGNKNGGWQYYNITLEGNMDRDGTFEKIVHMDYVYSSTCPCSTELAMHAIETRGQMATPHSQRSVMRCSIKFDGFLWFEDILAALKRAIPTEVQVFVKRPDEQAFAELNGSNRIFVEDAVRVVHREFDIIPEIIDFRLVASHNESLHAHDAIAVLAKWVEGGFSDHISPAELRSLVY